MFRFWTDRSKPEKKLTPAEEERRAILREKVRRLKTRPEWLAAEAPIRPVDTFSRLYDAISIIHDLKTKSFGSSVAAETGSTKIAILQELLSKSGHEEIAKTITVEELQETILDGLSEENLSKILEGEDERNQEQRQLVRRLLGIMLANDEDIRKTLKDIGYKDNEIDDFLKRSDLSLLFTALTEAGLTDNSAAMVAAKAYLISARVLLDEIRFGFLEKLDFIFPDDVRLASTHLSEQSSEISAAAPSSSVDDDPTAAAAAPPMPRRQKTDQPSEHLSRKPDTAISASFLEELNAAFRQRETRGVTGRELNIPAPHEFHDRFRNDIERSAKALEESRKDSSSLEAIDAARKEKDSMGRVIIAADTGGEKKARKATDDPSTTTTVTPQ